MKRIVLSGNTIFSGHLLEIPDNGVIEDKIADYVFRVNGSNLVAIQGLQAIIEDLS